MPLLPLLCLLLLPGVPAAWRPVRKTRTVRLKQGVVVGTVYQSDLEGLGRVEVYRGVPYAHAERFMPPSSPARFDYLEADRNGPVCPQNLVELDTTLQSGRSGSGRLAYLRRLIPFLKEQSEDCLNLNIYVPAEDERAGKESTADDEAAEVDGKTPNGESQVPSAAEPLGKPRVVPPASRSIPPRVVTPASRSIPPRVVPPASRSSPPRRAPVRPPRVRPLPRTEPPPNVPSRVRPDIEKTPNVTAGWRRCPRSAYVDGLGANLNVIVFIHGESFSWNSGNPYDGSTLASYGHVIFVTLNYRLGLLGFLNTRNNKTTSNFGLLDQIAALRWLKDNIAEFGGDPNSITLMGHHTGAIAVNYLMLSPVTQGDNGLFQRAIMMSGTALSGWAQSRSPEKMARAVAEQTRCPPDDLLACLREKRLHEILAVRDLPEDPAPSVDGIVVKIQPKDLMSHNNDLFTRYDLLCGVTESESYHILDSFALKQGLFPEDIKELLSKFFKENFERWEQCQEKAMKVYGLDKPTLSPMDGRDSTLTLLSDARVVAPMVQTAVYHSTPGKRDIRTYFYVFAHQSKHGDHPLAGMSVQGEDLAYVLGVPLEVGLHHFPQEYSQEEKHLSETIMSLWVNFAKTGDPNIPKKRNYLTSSDVVDVEWSPYEPNNQVFYQIQIPPRMGTKYRDNLMHFWNHFLPTWKPPQVPLTAPNKYTNSLNPGYDVLPRKQSGPDWPIFPPWRPTRKPVYGILVTSRPMLNPRVPPMDDAPPTPTDGGQEEVTSASTSMLSVVILVGVLFLIINLISFAYIWYQKKKLRKERMMARYRRGSSPSIHEDFEKKEDKCEIKSILKSNEKLYDPVKVKGSTIGKWTGLYSHGSASTVTIDPHTKVSQWMKSEKASIPSKGKSSETIFSAAQSLKGLRALRKPEVKKVSVGIDATPGARSASVLRQIPIELTKSLDFGKQKIGSSLKPAFQRCEVLDSDDERCFTSHSHSNSDPAQLLSIDDEYEKREEKVLRTFEPMTKDFKDFLSREDGESSISADETVDNFKRRNYPKVLPDLPTSPSLSGSDYGRTKRMSLPVPTPVIDARKMPPPPPPRAPTATISRSHRTTLPSYMSEDHKSKATTDKEDHKSDKEGKSSKKGKDSKSDKKKESKIERRPEPRVIIKPTLSDPNQKKPNSKIPRVTAKDQPHTPKEQKKLMSELKSSIKSKASTKKPTGTETSGEISETSRSSSVSSIATVKKAPKE